MHRNKIISQSGPKSEVTQMMTTTSMTTTSLATTTYGRSQGHKPRRQRHAPTRTSWPSRTRQNEAPHPPAMSRSLKFERLDFSRRVKHRWPCYLMCRMLPDTRQERASKDGDAVGWLKPYIVFIIHTWIGTNERADLEMERHIDTWTRRDTQEMHRPYRSDATQK